MIQTRTLMGMPIRVEIEDENSQYFDLVYEYFDHIDHKFSTYKEDSEISQINRGLKKYSTEMKEVLDLCEQTKKETNGYFDIKHNGRIDPSGLVKGWSIYNASKILKEKGVKNFYIDAGGDAQMFGKTWKVGIRNPFNKSEVIKVLDLKDCGIATSGTYERGQHIYNPLGEMPTDIASITVVGPNVYEADRFATAAFVMGRKGLEFIKSLPGFWGYMIDNKGVATYYD